MPNKCKGCRKDMTWAAVKVQWGRLMKKGFAVAKVIPIMPRCQKCVTRYLRELKK